MAGRMLGGRYTVQDKVGTGGMAIVYRGLDNVLGRTVAVKTMLPQYAADPSFAIYGKAVSVKSTTSLFRGPVINGEAKYFRIIIRIHQIFI